MRDPERIERITNKLRTLWTHSSDSRFFQLLCNSLLVNHYKAKRNDEDLMYLNDPFFFEDSAVEAKLDELLTKFDQKT